MLRLLYFLFVLVAVAELDTQARSQGPQQPQAPAVTTLKANARIVVLDVVVTDKNQKPIHNLKPSDFTVLEANAPQTIKNFEEHSTLSRADMAKLPPMPKLPPGLFTNYSPTPPGALNVLLLDALNTPIKNQMFVRDQLLQYVKNAPRGVPIAIFGLNEQLVMLQGFTTDPDVLKSVVEHNVLPGVSRKLDDPLTGEGTPNSVADALNAMGADDIGVLISNIQNFEAVQQSVDIQQRTSQTLDAMNAIAHYLSAFPGRKNLIWFSASFPLSILPDGSGINHPFDVVINSEDEFRETATLLANSRVSVYPIDARGLINATAEGASSDGAKYATNFGVIAQQNKAANRNFEEHGTMDQMANNTGGRAFLDTNGLAEAVSKAVDQGSNYYTITYSPSDPKDDGSFRKIQLKLQQQGLNLDYRRGYYAEKAKPGTDAAAPAANTIKTMDLAMVHGAPSPSQIMVKARVLPSATTSEDTLAPGNSPNAKLKEPIKGPYRRYLIDIAADPNDVALVRETDGKFSGNLQVMTFVYDQNGLLIGTTAKSIHTNLTPDGYRQLYQRGLQLHQEVSVPLKGDYYLRIGLHDLNSNRVGAVEVPVAAVKNLTPPPASVPTSNTTSPGAPN
jgi:VWFA-related protein